MRQKATQRNAKGQENTSGNEGSVDAAMVSSYLCPCSVARRLFLLLIPIIRSSSSLAVPLCLCRLPRLSSTHSKSPLLPFPFALLAVPLCLVTIVSSLPLTALSSFVSLRLHFDTGRVQPIRVVYAAEWRLCAAFVVRSGNGRTTAGLIVDWGSSRMPRATMIFDESLGQRQ